MCHLLKLTIFAAILAVTVAGKVPAKLPLFGQHKLMNFMVKSRDISQRNPQRSLECFDYYIPILNDITAQYEANYAACLKAADDSRLKADNATQDERNAIDRSAESACMSLKACTDNNSSIPYFECFANVGGENSKTMYAISANASEALVNLREVYELIQNEQNRCTNTSERTYVEDTTTTYEQLHRCLMGLSGVPTPTESTPTTIIDTTQTTESTDTTGLTDTTGTSESTDMSTSEPTSSDAIETTPALENPANRNARHAIKDSKWAHILEKIGRHAH